jgi:uncharacterized protein (TIGR02147 family)
MDSLFSYTDYREYLIDIVQERKLKGKTNAELAKVMGCQAAYLSQVLVGKVEFTEDHIVRLCEHLAFNDVETEYLLLLLRLGKAGSPDLRKYLIRQRERLKVAAEDLEERLPSEKINAVEEPSLYYASSFLPSIVHLATSCKSLRSKQAIAARFSLEPKVVQEHLDLLEKYKMIEFKNGEWIYSGGSRHFPKRSPLDKQMQFARRLLAMNKMSQSSNEQDVHYSAIFSADEKTLALLRKHFHKSIEYVHKTVDPVEGEDVFGICLDVFHA